VIWALGSMLGATQSVDMISSLKTDYAWVEVAVLNTNLLPDRIDTVAIGDRLYSLPIKVEGCDNDEGGDAHMELDDGSNGAGHHGDNTNENSSDKGSGPVTQQNTSSNGTPQHSNGQTSGKQVVENLEARRTHYAGHNT
jgi:hypothetical protein